MTQALKNIRGGLSLAATLVLLSGAALAQTASTTGEVKKVDAEAGRIVINHDDWPEMKMHAMTMGFGVKDRAVLANVKARDRIRFTVEKNDRDWLVTKIEPATPQGATRSAR